MIELGPAILAIAAFAALLCITALWEWFRERDQ